MSGAVAGGEESGDQLARLTGRWCFPLSLECGLGGAAGDRVRGFVAFGFLTKAQVLSASRQQVCVVFKDSFISAGRPRVSALFLSPLTTKDLKLIYSLPLRRASVFIRFLPLV